MDASEKGSANGIAELDENGKVPSSQLPSDSNINSLIGAPNGIAGLDANGKIPASQLPSYVDDIVEYNSSDDFPLTGESGKIYYSISENKSYRWSGSQYAEIFSSTVVDSITIGQTTLTEDQLISLLELITQQQEI